MPKMNDLEKLNEKLHKRGCHIAEQPDGSKRIVHTATGRYFLATWHAEVADDLKKFHGVDAYKETMDAVLDQIDLELNPTCWIARPEVTVKIS